MTLLSDGNQPVLVYCQAAFFKNSTPGVLKTLARFEHQKTISIDKLPGQANAALFNRHLYVMLCALRINAKTLLLSRKNILLKPGS